MNEVNGPLEEIGGDWFVNRKAELDLFWGWGTSIPDRVKGSYALIGLRRTGKTAILHRLFNRLFHEQEKVLPVYVSFGRYVKRPEPINAYEFAESYFTGYLRSYLAFRHRQPHFHSDMVELDSLREFANQTTDEIALELLKLYDVTRATKYDAAHSLMQWVINFPKGYAWRHKMPTAILIDEFQVLTSVYNPDYTMVRNVTSSFQQAAETRWAPLLVSGSAVSIMVDDALGGMLSGRFRPWHLGALTQEYAFDMIFRLAQSNQIGMTEAAALAIWDLTQGYPYPIECLLNTDCPAVAQMPSLDALAEVLTYELTHTGGALWSHYKQEYGKYIHDLNGDQTTRKVLLWIIKYPERRIFADEIATELALEERKVQDSLEKLHAADIITSTGWYSYAGPADPMLRRYIEYSHAREVEKLAPEEVAQSLIPSYRKL